MRWARRLVTALAVSLLGSPGTLGSPAPPVECEGDSTRAVLSPIDATSASARASVEYCRRAAGVFRGRLSAEGLAPNGVHRVTLNGITGRPGNESLPADSGCVLQGTERHCDFAEFRTDGAGTAALVALELALPPGTFEVKLFVKDSAFKVALKQDSVHFESTAIEIVEPARMAKVPSIATVRGRVADRLSAVVVLVRPLARSQWWVQPPPLPANSDGRWQTRAHFGTQTLGRGEDFELVGVVPSGPGQFREGDVLESEAVRRLLETRPHTDIVAVQRTP